MRKIAIWSGVFVLSILVLIVLLDITYNFRRTSAYRASRIYTISIIQALATPSRYDRMDVALAGYLTLREEDYNLYLDEQSAALQLPNAIETNFHLGPVTTQNAERFRNRYVVLYGCLYMHGASQWPVPYRPFAPVLARIFHIDPIPQRSSIRRPKPANC